MRHRNVKSISCCSEKLGQCITVPRSFTTLTFSKPSLERQYVKIIQYVYDHPGCKRADVVRDVIGIKDADAKDTWYPKALRFRGQHCTVFANLLYADLIDYDKCYCYHVTDKGMNMLIKCY